MIVCDVKREIDDTVHKAFMLEKGVHNTTPDSSTYTAKTIRKR